MLCDGLRAELPELFDLASRLRRPSVPAMPLWAAVVGGLGARTLTAQFLIGVLSASSLVTSFSLRTVEATTIASIAVGVLFAFGAAGSRGLLATSAVFVALWLEQFVIGLPGTQVFCSRSGPLALSHFTATCDPLLLALNGLWPIAVGIALGVAVRKLVSHGVPGVSALVLAIGGWALFFAALRVPLAIVVGPAPEVGPGGTVLDAFNWFAAASALGAVGLGYVAGRWGRRHLFDAAALLAFYILPWVTQARLLWDTPEPFRDQLQWQMFTPVIFALAALSGLVIGALVQRGELGEPT